MASPKHHHPHHHHGFVVPLFALWSKQSAGIGEIPNLIPFLQWCASLGFDTVQLLPLNDSGFDPSPYYTLSSCAINPVYLGLNKLPFLDEHKGLVQQIELLQSLNEETLIAYEEVRRLKDVFLEHYIEAVGERLLQTPEYAYFVKKSPWLEPHAIFSSPKNPTLFKLTQFLLFEQLKAVKEEANRLGVLLMGDSPILSNADSFEVNHFPLCFDKTYHIGAPPDMFNTEGQDWGFPLICWEEVEKADFLFWRWRFSALESFYHLFRLDHIIGFFRLWSIPKGAGPKQGRFIPTDFQQSLEQGKHLLKQISKMTQMVPIGEDLGTVPQKAKEILQHENIFSTKVLRWERYWEEDGRYIPLDAYPSLSLSTLSTHDTETLEQWWHERKEEVCGFLRLFHASWGPLTRERRFELLQRSHQTSSKFHVNLLGEYLALFPELVHPDFNQERINVPGTLRPENWRYKFRLPLEDLLAHRPLSAALSKLVASFR